MIVLNALQILRGKKYCIYTLKWVMLQMTTYFHWAWIVTHTLAVHLLYGQRSFRCLAECHISYVCKQNITKHGNYAQLYLISQFFF